MITSRNSRRSSGAAGSRKTVWTTSFGSIVTWTTRPIEQALRVRRAKAADELDAGREDLLADAHLRGRVDVGHDERATQLPDDLAGGRAAEQLAGHGRRRVADEDDVGDSRPDLGDAPDEGAARADDDLADGEAVVRAAVDDERAPGLRGLAGDDRDGARLVVEAVPELEQRGQFLVLAPELGRAAALGVQQVILGPKRRVLLAELVDLGDRRGDGRDLARDAIDRLLDRLEGEGDAVLELADQLILTLPDIIFSHAPPHVALHHHVGLLVHSGQVVACVSQNSDSHRNGKPDGNVMQSVWVDDFQFIDTVFRKLVVEIFVQFANTETAEV